MRTPLLKQEGRTKKPVTVKPLPRVYEPPLMPMADYEAAQRSEQEAAAGIGAVGARAAGALLSAGLALGEMLSVIGGVLKGAMTAGLTALCMLLKTGAVSVGTVVGIRDSFRGDEAALEQWMKRFKDPGTRGKAILELKQGIGLTREPTSAQPERNRAAEVYLVMSDVLRKDPSSGEYEGLKKTQSAGISSCIRTKARARRSNGLRV